MQHISQVKTMTTLPIKISWAMPSVALSALFALTGCFAASVGDLCAPGHNTTAEGAHLCVVEQPIVIETGFECPAERPHRFEGDGVTVCSDSPNPPPEPLDTLLPWPEAGNPPDPSLPSGDRGTTDNGAGTAANANQDDVDEVDEPDEPDEVDEPDEPDEVDDPDEPDDPDEVDDPNGVDDPDDSH